MLSDFKREFFKVQNGLKTHGFLSYCFYQDQLEPGIYLLVFQCSDMRQAVDFLRSSNFVGACVGSGKGLPPIWAGTLKFGSLPSDTSALVVGNYESQGDSSKSVWNGRTPPSLFPPARSWGLYDLAGGQIGVLLAQEVPDIIQARRFMNSEMTSTDLGLNGVTHPKFWFGTYLENGSF